VGQKDSEILRENDMTAVPNSGVQRATQPDPAMVRQQLERMSRSRVFAQAGRMFPLLDYLVTGGLDAALPAPDQRRIAIEVFGRDEQFDPSCDAIVRVEVGRLRTKLLEYYATDGADDDVHIDVPRGTYAAHIEVRHSVARLYRDALPPQTIRYCEAPDGVRLACSTVGKGYPLILLSHWLSHLEADAANPFVRHYLAELSRRFQLIRYDTRGFGLSQRGLPALAFDDLVTDLATVVDALGLERCALVGPSGGAPVGTPYAARYPERVSHLVLLGGFIRGPRANGDPNASEFADGVESMIRNGWGQPHSRFRNFFVAMLVPDGTPELYRRMDEAQLAASSGANAERFFRVMGDFDLSGEAGRVRAPTLVFHGTEETGVPFAEAEHAASKIPGARLVPLPTKNHVLMPDEPAWPMFLDELDRFVADSA
jgi:pimeloyl-ACP methyl ester carboxylesterase